MKQNSNGSRKNLGAWTGIALVVLVVALLNWLADKHGYGQQWDAAVPWIGGIGAILFGIVILLAIRKR